MRSMQRRLCATGRPGRLRFPCSVSVASLMSRRCIHLKVEPKTEPSFDELMQSEPGNFLPDSETFGFAITNWAGEEVGQAQLRKNVFLRQPVRRDLLHRVVHWQLARRRAGTSCSKSRSEKSGSTRKIARQKGRGMARVGQLRAPNRIGGGYAFPRKPRNYDYPLPKDVRRQGLAHALSAKLAQKQLVIMDSLDLETHKTRDLLQLLQDRGWTSALLMDGEDVSHNLRLASSNIGFIDVLAQRGFNVYDILYRELLVISSQALDHLQTNMVRTREPLYTATDPTPFLLPGEEPGVYVPSATQA